MAFQKGHIYISTYTKHPSASVWKSAPIAQLWTALAASVKWSKPPFSSLYACLILIVCGLAFFAGICQRTWKSDSGSVTLPFPEPCCRKERWSNRTGDVYDPKFANIIFASCQMWFQKWQLCGWHWSYRLIVCILYIAWKYLTCMWARGFFAIQRLASNQDLPDLMLFLKLFDAQRPQIYYSRSLITGGKKVAKVQIQNPWKATPDPSIPFRSQHPNPYYPLLYSNFLGCCDAFHFRIWGRTNSPAKPLPTNAVFAFDTAVSAAFSALVAWQKRSMPFSQYLSGFESCLYRKESSTMQETYWVYSVIQTHNTLFPFEC